MKLTRAAASFAVLALLATGLYFDGFHRVAAAPTLAVNRCQNFQLLIRPQSSQGAAGSLAVIFRIHNLSGQTCTLTGYPGVRLLNKQFLTLPTTVQRGAGGLIGAIPVRTVTLTGHGNAYFALGYSDVPVNNGPCPTDYYLMVFAPNAYLPVVTYPFPHGGHIVACSGNLHVSPVTATPRYQ